MKFWVAWVPAHLFPYSLATNLRWFWSEAAAVRDVRLNAATCHFLTIDELFERLREDAARDPVMFEVTFDEELGFPRTAVVDVSAGVADDEYRFEIREVSPIESLE